jgi:hypothetical protein
MDGIRKLLRQMHLVIARGRGQPLQLSLPTAAGSSSPSPCREVSILARGLFQDGNEGWSIHSYMNRLLLSQLPCQMYNEANYEK